MVGHGGVGPGCHDRPWIGVPQLFERGQDVPRDAALRHPRAHPVGCGLDHAVGVLGSCRQQSQLARVLDRAQRLERETGRPAFRGGCETQEGRGAQAVAHQHSRPAGEIHAAREALERVFVLLPDFELEPRALGRERARFETRHQAERSAAPGEREDEEPLGGTGRGTREPAEVGGRRRQQPLRAEALQRLARRGDARGAARSGCCRHDSAS